MWGELRLFNAGERLKRIGGARGGRPLFDPEIMLKIHFIQAVNNLLE